MVLSFLDQIARYYSKGRVVIITDNISTRTGDAAAEWLRRHPRIRFVFTPRHGSWLNQVEIGSGSLPEARFDTVPSPASTRWPPRSTVSAGIGTRSHAARRASVQVCSSPTVTIVPK